jgi:hypothetical protein
MRLKNIAFRINSLVKRSGFDLVELRVTSSSKNSSGEYDTWIGAPVIERIPVNLDYRPPAPHIQVPKLLQNQPILMR